MRLKYKTKFNALNKQRKQISGEYHEEVQKLVSKYLSDFTYKRTGYFSFKVRDNKLSSSTKYNLFVNQPLSNHYYNFGQKTYEKHGLKDHVGFIVETDNITLDVTDENLNNNIKNFRSLVDFINGEKFEHRYINYYLGFFVEKTDYIASFYCSYFIEQKTNDTVEAFFAYLKDCKFIDDKVLLIAEHNKSLVKYGNKILKGAKFYELEIQEEDFILTKKILIDKSSKYPEQQKLQDIYEIETVTLNKHLLLDYHSNNNICNHIELFNNVHEILKAPFDKHRYKWGKKILNDNIISFKLIFSSIIDAFLKDRGIEYKTVYEEDYQEVNKINSFAFFPYYSKFLTGVNVDVKETKVIPKNIFIKDLLSILKNIFDLNVSIRYTDLEVYYNEQNPCYLSNILNKEDKEFKKFTS